MTDKTIVLPPNPNGNGDTNYRITAVVPRRRYLSYLRNRWWVVMLCLALVVGGVVTYETVRQETYSSYAQLYVTLPPQLGLNLFAEPKDDFATQIELLKGSRLRREALESLGTEAVSRLKGPIKVDVVRPMATSILQLQVTSSDPNVSRNFLEALIARYRDFKKDTRLSTTKDLLDSLNQELAKAETNLATSKEKLTGFQKTNSIIVVQQEARTANLALADLQMQLEKALFDRRLREQGLSPTPAADSTNIPALTPASDLVAGVTNLTTDATNLATAGSNAPSMSALDSIDMQLRDAKVMLTTRQTWLEYFQNHKSELTPDRANELHALPNELTELKLRVAALEKQDAIERQKELEKLKQRIAAILQQIPSVETNLQAASDLLAQSQLINDEVQRQQAYYDSLLKMLNSVDLNKNMAQEGVSEYEPPSAGVPSPRSLPFRIALASVGGLVLGLGLVFLWHLFDDRLVSVHDLKDQFGETLLGLVPRVRVPKSKPFSALLEPGDSRAGYVESYRHLRSALMLSARGEARPQTLLLTGATPAEGKTTIAVNLARVLAQSGQRVALVDADLRGGHMHQMLGREAAPGLLDFLDGRAEAGAIIHPTELPGLVFVPSGAASGHPDGLLNRSSLGDLMKELKEERDFVILDCAPILTADDASLLVPYADEVLLVMCPFYTRAGQVRRALEMLYQRQARQVGLILNRARTDDLAGQYYARNGASHAAKNGKA